MSIPTSSITATLSLAELATNLGAVILSDTETSCTIINAMLASKGCRLKEPDLIHKQLLKLRTDALEFREGIAVISVCRDLTGSIAEDDLQITVSLRVISYIAFSIATRDSLFKRLLTDELGNSAVQVPMPAHQDEGQNNEGFCT